MSPEWAGRFDDRTFGAYYTANRFETAVAETAFHKAVFFESTEEAAGWLAQMRELVGAIDNTLHDLRCTRKFKDCLDPESYTTSQKLARRLRSAGSNGITYKSVRDPQGEAVVAFRPSAVSSPVPGRQLAYHFDGERIDLVRDEESGEVWRFV